MSLIPYYEDGDQIDPASAPTEIGGNPNAMPADPNAAPPGDPAAMQGGDALGQVQGLLQQYATSRDPQLAVQGFDILVQAGAAGAPGGDPAMQGQGGMQPQGAAPQDPGTMQQQGPPMGRQGMQLPAYGGGGTLRFVKI